MSTIDERKQLLSPGRIVELFEFNARKQGSANFRFCSTSYSTEAVLWRGNRYAPFPIEASGFSWSGEGKLPRPKLSISNITLLPSAVINDIGDPIGAEVVRWITFERFLDLGSDPDPDQYMPPQVYIVERKVAHTNLVVEFELISALDVEGRRLPGRQVIANFCNHSYRIFDKTESSVDYFDYENVSCPYKGIVYFTITGDSTSDPSEDVCGKRLSDCRKRFGSANPLPFRGFPAAARRR